METTTIYRVEHPVLGCGPWNTHVHPDFDSLSSEQRYALDEARSALNNYFWDNEYYAATHPNVRSDFGLWHEFYKCATPCLKTLRDWFAMESFIIDKLFDAGFTVMEYVVKSDAVLNSRSGTQVAFKPDSVIDSRDITVLALLN